MKEANSPNGLAYRFEHPRFHASSDPAQVFFVDAQLLGLQDTPVKSRGVLDQRCVAASAYFLHDRRDLAQQMGIEGDIAAPDAFEHIPEPVFLPA